MAGPSPAMTKRSEAARERSMSSCERGDDVAGYFSRDRHVGGGARPAIDLRPSCLLWPVVTRGVRKGNAGGKDGFREPYGDLWIERDVR